MDGIFVFILFFAFILFLQGLGGGKKKNNRNVEQRMRQRLAEYQGEQTQQRHQQSRRPQQQSNKPTPFQDARGAAAMQTAQRTVARKAVRTAYDEVEGMDKVKDRNDKNRNRRADWGERNGPGLLSFRNSVLLLLGLFLILAIGFSLPADF